MTEVGKRMDRIYRGQRHIYDATRKFFLLGRDRLIADLDPAPGARILEIGCGTGRNLVAVAQRYPLTRLYGLDVSPLMLRTAGATIGRAGLADRIALAEADAADFDAQALFAVPAFDRIVCSYVLSMIPAWRPALRHVAGQLAPGGSLHVVDFGPCGGLPDAATRALDRWLGQFSVERRTDLRDMLCATADESGYSCEYRAPMAGYFAVATLRRGDDAALARDRAA